MDNEFFFGLKLKKTGELISSQIVQILSKQSIEFETRAIYLLMVLKEKKQASIKEISGILGMTHPAVVQMANSLRKHGIIIQDKLESDKRLTLLKLTDKGLKELERLEPTIKIIENIIKNITDEIDANLKYSLNKLNDSIKSNTLGRKVELELRQKALRAILIVPYNKKYKDDFARLNYEWLKKYFKEEKVELEDKRLLNNPEREIIRKGGEIFFAILNDAVVGTCAVIKINDSVFELAKMGVTEKEQGKQIGKKLALTAIGYAVENSASKLTLSTSSKLTAALNLYRSLGFKIVRGKVDDRYNRELLSMELDLKV